MTMQQNNWIYRIAAGIIVGGFLFILNSQWNATRALERRLANHTIEAARTYVPREEFVKTLNRLEDTIREAIRDAKNPH